MWQKVIDSKSKTFLAFCFCFLTGIAFGSLYNRVLSDVVVFGMFFILLASGIMFWRAVTIRFFLCCFCFLWLGCVRYSFALPHITEHTIMAHYGETHELTGVVADEPDVREDGVRYIVEIINHKSKIINDENLNGLVYVKSGLYPRYEYGEVLKIECTFARPEPVEDFRYDMYLARFGVFTLCNYPRMTSTKTMAGNPIKQTLLGLKQTVANRVNELWPEPYAGFMAGILYGYRGGLGALNDAFSRTGVTHIVAVSGYNISLIATILMTLCMSVLWIPRKQAFWCIVGGIIVFVLFTGASASVLRAGVMATIVLLGGYLGRPRRMVNVLAATAVVMTFMNPLILFWDVGFQLSFLSTFGIVYIAPILTPFFQKFSDRFGIKETLISTLAAIIGTLPLVLFQFGQLSLVAPLVNVLILWTLPYLMIGGFAAVCVSMLWSGAGQIVAGIVYVGMAYVIGVVKFFSGLPFAAITIPLTWWAMLLVYGLLGWGMWKLKKKSMV